MIKTKPVGYTRIEKFVSLLDSEVKNNLGLTGLQIIESIGEDTVRQIVSSVLRGLNIRESTEILTRKRLTYLNSEMLKQFIEFGSIDNIYSFLNDVYEFISYNKANKIKMSKDVLWTLYWTLGLTEKQMQNVMRDEHKSVKLYIEKVSSTLEDAVRLQKDTYGEISGEISFPGGKVDLSWSYLLYIALNIGSQTMTIRGSEKSIYGKLFERLVLGSALQVLDFEFSPSGPTDPSKRQFWLSTTEKREADLVAIVEPGKGIFFDIGFIGRGNSEITLDKTSRFARDYEINGRIQNMATIVVVDRIGKKSKVSASAIAIGAVVIQMSLSVWIKTLAQQINSIYSGWRHPILSMNEAEVDDFVSEKVSAMNIKSLINKSIDVTEQIDDLEE